MNKHERQTFYSGLDWSKSDGELVAQTGKVRSTINFWRRRLGLPPAVQHQEIRHARLLIQARHWKWSAPISALAKQHKLSRWWVYQIKRKLHENH